MQAGRKEGGRKQGSKGKEARKLRPFISPSLSFISLRFPFIPPSYLLPFPFVSLSVPLRFPCIPKFAVISGTCLLHVLAFPAFIVISPSFSLFLYLPLRKSKNNIQCFGQREAEDPSRQRVGRGTRIIKLPRYVFPPPHPSWWGNRRGGRGYPLSSLRCPTRRTMSADFQPNLWNPPARF